MEASRNRKQRPLQQLPGTLVSHSTLSYIYTSESQRVSEGRRAELWCPGEIAQPFAQPIGLLKMSEDCAKHFLFKNHLSGTS